MIDNRQIRKLRRHLSSGMALSQAALKSGMCEKSARKYRDMEEPQTRLSEDRIWRTRRDPFENVWGYVHEWLEADPGLHATDIFYRLQRDYPKLFDGSLRTLERGIAEWRASRQPSLQSDENAARQWMHDVLQGTPVNDLRSELGDVSFALLDNMIREGRMTERKRALTILAWRKGIPNAVIARFLNLDEKTTRRYRDLFRKDGASALFSRKRNIVCKSDDKRYVDPVLATLHAPPSAYGINRTTWKQDDLQQVLRQEGIAISKQNIRAILRKAGYRWRKAKRVLTSTDPEYKEKLAKITGILSTIRPTERFFSIDEFGPLHITKKPGRKLVGPGEKHVIPQRQRSRGRLIITAALELCTNQVTHFYSDRKNTDEMIRLVDVLTEQYAGMETLYFCWDAASWHMSRKFYSKIEQVNSENTIRDGLPRLELVPLPACAQFLNVIESVFSGMARAIIHNSDYASVEEAKEAIDRHFADRNEWFRKNPGRAGNKIWGAERTPSVFSEANNCKDPRWR